MQLKHQVSTFLFWACLTAAHAQDNGALEFIFDLDGKIFKVDLPVTVDALHDTRKSAIRNRAVGSGCGSLIDQTEQQLNGARPGLLIHASSSKIGSDEVLVKYSYLYTVDLESKASRVSSSCEFLATQLKSIGGGSTIIVRTTSQVISTSPNEKISVRFVKN